MSINLTKSEPAATDMGTPPATKLPDVIDVEWLREQGACKSGIERFIQRFADGTMCPSRESLAKCDTLDVRWLARQVFSDLDYTIFLCDRDRCLYAHDAGKGLTAYRNRTAAIFCSIAGID